MVNQLNDTYNTKDKKLNPFKIVVILLLYEFHKYSIQNIPKTNNMYTNAMASTTLLEPIDIKDEETILKIQKLGTPSYLEHIEVHTCHLDIESDPQQLYIYICNYLKDQTIPSSFDRNEKVRLKRKDVKYVIIGEVLYKSSFDGALFRCIIQHEIVLALEQAHDGLFGGYFHAKALYTKLLRIGYY